MTATHAAQSAVLSQLYLEASTPPLRPARSLRRNTDENMMPSQSLHTSSSNGCALPIYDALIHLLSVESNRELSGLALLNDLTTLQFAIEDIQTLLFTVQELRHAPDATSSATSASNSTQEPPSQVDSALMQLDSKLETALKDYADLEERSGTSGQQFLGDKLQGLKAQLDRAQRDIDVSQLP